MTWLYAVLLALVNLLWLALTAFGLPGNWLMVLSAAALAWWQREAGMFSPWVLAAAAVLAALGEITEFVSGALGARGGGGTRWGAAGALVGGVAGGLLGTGLIPLPVLGTFLGLCLGAFVGAVGAELATGRRLRGALGAGRGAAVGYGLGVLAKLALGVVIWVVVTIAAFWP